MKKTFKLLALFIILSSVLCALFIDASAEDTTTYYVSYQSGYDRNDGKTADTALKTIERAYNNALRDKAARAVIVITDEYKQHENFKELSHSEMPVVITSYDGVTDYRKSGAKIVYGNTKRFYLEGDTTFENITFDYEVSINFVAQFNRITFGDGVKFNQSGECIGIYVVGGWQNPPDSAVTDLDSHITIKSGEFAVVCGGSRQKAVGGKGAAYSGTHYIDIKGGHIGELFGGTLEEHTANNLVLNVSGGEIDIFHAGGGDDGDRCLNGKADISLNGGKIGNFICDNAVGGATVKLIGTGIGKMSAGYTSRDVQRMCDKNGSENVLQYDLVSYSKEQIASFEGFDRIEGITDVYVKSGARGSGMSESDPTSLEKAFDLISDIGGTIKIIGKVSLSNFREPEHSAAITVQGTSRDSAIAVSGKYTLTGETVFENISISGNFNAENGLFTAGRGVVSDSVNIIGNAVLRSGNYNSIENAKNIIIKGASVGELVGSESCRVVLRSGKIETVENPSGAKLFELSVFRGSIGKATFRMADKLVYRHFGGSVSQVAVEGDGIIGTYVGDENTLGEHFEPSAEKVFFVSNDGDGMGTSPLDAAGSIEAAYKALGESGGTVVVCGPYTHNCSNTLVNIAPIVITSLYDGVDYAKENGAKMLFKTNFYCGGETKFCDVTLVASDRYLSIVGNGNKLHIGENITSIADKYHKNYLCLVAGNAKSAARLSTDMTVDSGIWHRVRGGNSDTGSNCDISLTVNGGEFYEFSLASKNGHTGDIKAVINGGTFFRGVSVSVYENEGANFSGDVVLDINGGIFYDEISVSNENKGEAYGSFTLNINGGDFNHINEIIGAEQLDGNMTSTLNVTGAIDIEAKIEGETSFTNAIRQNGADPWLFYHDGYYYYIASAENTLSLARARNLGDLKYAESRVIYSPGAGHPWSMHQWSPEIHYYTDEQIGDGNGGWYCYIAPCYDDQLREGEQDHRMYVIKCLDGDNLMGRWGNPVTGEVNVPERVVAPDIPDWDSTWAGGQSGVVIDGKPYTLYVGMSKEREANGRKYQYICIVPMTNPWTIKGLPTMICRPDYDWEKVGSETGGTQVVEGATAVYGADGSVYIIYSGSGYWTTEYQLGQLRYLGGDPCDAKNWEKKPTSIFRQNGVLTGSGHASYVTDTFGQGWICYHAYVGDPDTFENRSHPEYGGGRLAFVEPYYADKNGVVIADGAGEPAPLDRVYVTKLDPTPLSERISGFGAVDNSVTLYDIITAIRRHIADGSITLDAVKNMMQR